MNKKILISLSVIGAVAAIAIGGTIAYFSDTETSTGNTFTAGTIDISVDNMNPWNETFTLADMKPSYVDYINFEIQNTGSDPNPVDVWKKITVTSETTGVESEPECTEGGGCWDNSAKACDWHSTGCQGTDKNDLSSAIWYDLYVEVLNASSQKVWWQTIYPDGVKTIDDVYGTDGIKEVYLGMIPAGYSMKVTQSYHMKGDTTNWAQGDQMTFDIALRAEQIQGTAVLENKTGDPDWQILGDDTIKGTLTYNVKGPKFDYGFTGTAPSGSTEYCLWIGGTPTGANWDAKIKLGCNTSASDGNIAISGNPDLGQDVKDGKAWLIKAGDYDGTTWLGWNPTQYLWETGLIWYDDMDI